MGNPLIIENKGTTTDKLNALINVVNILTTQMYEGRVKQAQIDIQSGATATEANRVELERAITDMDLMMIESEIAATEMDLRLLALEG